MSDVGTPGAPVESTRMQALRGLSNQLPVANSQVAAGQQAAQQMQLQSAVQAAGPKTQTTATGQDTGAAAAAQTGQQMVGNAQNSLAQNNQVGQLGLQAQGQQNQAEVSGLQLGSQQQQMDNTQRLAALSASTKAQLYDANIQFQKDETGRTLFNEAQLADYARTKAQTDEQFRNYSQTANQLTDRNLQMMNTAYAKIQEDITNKYQQAKQAGDEQLMQQLTKQKHDADMAMQEAKNKAANSTAMWSAGLGIAGAAAGSLAGPAGAGVGYSAGSALGQMASSQTSNNTVSQ